MSRAPFFKLSKSKGIALRISVFLAVLILLLYIIPALAAVNPGQGPFIDAQSGSLMSASANLTRGDIFFANGDTVFVVANYTCSGTTSFCNSSMNVSGNFSQIGGSQWIKGVFKRTNSSPIGEAGQAGWALFELNETVNFSAISGSTINVAQKTIFLNATDGNWTGENLFFFNNTANATVVLWNMSYIPGCPPAGEGVSLPPNIPLLNGTSVSVSGCITTCTGNDRLERNATNHWNLCGPNVAGDSTNFTAVASTGNFSNFALVIDVTGKAKINFTQNVSMDTPNKAASLFQFAMKNIMSGGRVAINDSEWNGTDTTKLNLSMLNARLTIYNMSGRMGITAPHMPQISRSSYGANSFSACSPSICSNTVWDGENITFTVTGFSEYDMNQGLAVTTNTPATTSQIRNNSLVSTAPAKNINFTFTPKWNSTVSVKNATLYGNFSSGGVWTANATNTTSLINNSVNGINFSVPAEGGYLWNVVIYEVLNTSDANTTNATVFLDTVEPGLTVTSPTAGTVYTTASVDIIYTATDAGSGISACSYNLDSGGSVNTGASKTVATGTISSGVHSLLVSCVDAAGNPINKTVSFTMTPSGGGGTTGGGTTSPSATTTTTRPPPLLPTKVEIPSINVGETKTVSVQKTEDHGLKEISITAKNAVVSVSLDIVRLADKPASVAIEASGKVYNYIEINKTNLKAEDIDKVKIKFVVSKSWLTSNNIDPAKVVLSRYTTQWDKLPTSKLSETTSEIEYDAQSAGFSYFAISGEALSATTTTAGKTSEGAKPIDTTALIVILIILGAGAWFVMKKKSFSF